ncbi:unnamed protein product [Moneuplotes crassus]|uniref:Ion transport domain-containing protein n=2 Tax=Euplotes crassus TaxID=5936 RepID=A0AAD1U8F4_EUPCR|nr:unnamed protein product [Moneuplotes crassus]
MFDKNTDYTARFIQRHSKTCQFPSSSYLSCQFHPSLKDHLVTLSKVNCPSTSKFNYSVLEPHASQDPIAEPNRREFYREFIKKIEELKKQVDAGLFEEEKCLAQREDIPVEETKYPSTHNLNISHTSLSNYYVKTEVELNQVFQDSDRQYLRSDEEEPEGGSDDENQSKESHKSADPPPEPLSINNFLKSGSQASNLKEENKSNISDNQLLEDSSHEDNAAEIDDHGRGNSSRIKLEENSDKEITLKKLVERSDPKLFEEKKLTNIMKKKSLPSFENPQESLLNENAAQESSPRQLEENKNDSSEEDAIEETKDDKGSNDGEGEDQEDPKENNEQPIISPFDLTPEEKENLELAEKAKNLYKESESFPKEARQRILDEVFDKIYEENYAPVLLYRSSSTSPSVPVPIEEADLKEDCQTFDKAYVSNNRKCNELFEGMSYRPQISRHQYELSLWKVTPQCVSRISHRYFSLKGEFENLKIMKCIDGKGIFLTGQRTGEQWMKMVAVVQENWNESGENEEMEYLDKKKISQFEFDCEDEEDGVYEESASFYEETPEVKGDISSLFPTAKNCPSFALWNKGRYLLTAITKPERECHSYYLIHDLEKDKIVAKIIRKGILQHNMIYSFQHDPEDPDIICICTFGQRKVQVLRYNCKTDKCTPLSENKISSEALVPEDIVLREDLQEYYIIYSLKTMGYSGFSCQRVKIGDNQPVNLGSGQPKRRLQTKLGKYFFDRKNFIMINNFTQSRTRLDICGDKEIGQDFLFDSIPNGDEIIDCGIIQDSWLLSCMRDENSFNIRAISLDEEGTWITHQIKPFEIISYKNNYVSILKEQSEMFNIDLRDGEISYLRLRSPLVLSSNMEQYKDIAGVVPYLIDLGSKLLYITVYFEYQGFQISFSPMQLEKKNLPVAKLTGVFASIDFKFAGNENEETTVLTEFIKCNINYSSKILHWQSLIKIDNRRTLELDRDDSNFKTNIFHIMDRGLVLWKKGGKRVQFHSKPINLEDSKESKTIYISQEVIFEMTMANNSYQTEIYLCDEPNFVKSCTLSDGKDIQIDIVEDFFVGNHFQIPQEGFKVCNKMLYQGLKGSLLQPKETKTEDLVLFWEIEEHQIPTKKVQTRVPLFSENTLMWQGFNEKNDIAELMILPCYNDPSFKITSPPSGSYAEQNFFYHSNDDYIVYHWTPINYGTQYPIDIVKANGEIVQTLMLDKFDTKGKLSSSYFYSPNMRYVATIEPHWEESDDYYSKLKDITIIVYEFCQNSETKEFYLKEIRNIDSAVEELSLKLSTEFSYSEYYTFYLMNDKSIAYKSDYPDEFSIEGFCLNDSIQKELKREETGYIKEALYPKENGVVISFQENVYNLDLNIDNSYNPYSIKKLNFNIQDQTLSISSIHLTRDPNFIVIIFYDTSGGYITVVWNLKENIEQYNFSSTECPCYFFGKNSRFGYIWCSEYYVNLDLGLKNFYFEHYYYGASSSKGYLINKKEDLFLSSSVLITKETIVEVNSLDGYLQNGPNITKNNINLERIRFQVDNNTMIHYFALEYDTLTLILDYMEQHKAGYLTAILMPNKNGKSALDITIEKESPKNTEALLIKILQFNDQKLSHLFADKFSQLVKMNIKAFNQYLNSCFFQTIQMKSIDNLQFKDKSDPVLVGHNCCMIDNNLIDTHCSNLAKRVLELEKIVRENKQKETLERRATLQRQITHHEEMKIKQSEDDELLDGEGEINSLQMVDPNEILESEIDITQKKKVTKEEALLAKYKNRQKKVKIKGIEFDWLFSNIQGPAFFKLLIQSQQIEIFSIPLIRYIIIYFWGFFRFRIMIFLFFPFLVYFAIFLLYTTWFHKRKIEHNEGNGEGFGLACSISVIIILLFLIKEAYYEIRQMMYHKLNYFYSFWNIIDLCSMMLNLIICISQFAGLADKDMNLIMSIAVIVMYLKLFYFGRIFLATASLVSMVIEITKDMKYFLMVFMISVAGFGHCYMILQNNLEGGIFDGDTYWNAFIYSYQNSLGDFNTDNFEGTDKYYLYTIWFMNVLIALIVLLNLLIAIMGDTFDRVRENSENNMLKELAAIMSENEMLINRDKKFSQYKYIIVVETDKGEEADIQWDGRLQRLRDYLSNTVEENNEIMKKCKTSIISKVKERAEKIADSMEESSQRRISNISSKADEIQMFLSKISNKIEENVLKTK